LAGFGDGGVVFGFCFGTAESDGRADGEPDESDELLERVATIAPTAAAATTRATITSATTRIVLRRPCVGSEAGAGCVSSGGKLRRSIVRCEDEV
jgi:hypothetical protein